jgi:hypothetical protein
MACGPPEPPWPEYKAMIGGTWSEQDPSSGHAPRHKFQVKIVDPSHPITEGLPETFEADDELYHNMHMADGVRILASAFDDPKNKPELRPGNKQPSRNGRRPQAPTVRRSGLTSIRIRQEKMSRYSGRCPTAVGEASTQLWDMTSRQWSCPGFPQHLFAA